jgi:hypothetical protein
VLPFTFMYIVSSSCHYNTFYILSQNSTDDSGFYPAVDRMKFLMGTKSLTEKEAKDKVMMEYPENF